jgi:hypothetical protein
LNLKPSRNAISDRRRRTGRRRKRGSERRKRTGRRRKHGSKRRKRSERRKRKRRSRWSMLGSKRRSRRSTLGSKRWSRRSLNALGFIWTLQEYAMRSFDKRIEDLKEYKRTHGHLSVKIHEDSSLYQFCAGVRLSLKQVDKDGTRKLMEERIARLDTLGFEWTTSLEASVDAAAPVHEK